MRFGSREDSVLCKAGLWGYREYLSKGSPLARTTYELRQITPLRYRKDFVSLTFLTNQLRTKSFIHELLSNLSTPFWETRGIWKQKDFKHCQIWCSCYTGSDRLPFQSSIPTRKSTFMPQEWKHQFTWSTVNNQAQISLSEHSFCSHFFTQAFISKYFQRT